MTPESGHRARKRFAQNFLHNQAVIEQIIQVFEPDPASAIIEIGPGKGALTLPLLEKTGQLNVIEIDRDLVTMLTEKCRDRGKLIVHLADALSFDFLSIQPQPLQIIGNLPYNISTPLIFHLLTSVAETRQMLFMLQKEVVDRICAEHNERHYGRLSVMVQAQCRVEKLFEVAPESFTPRPRVTSAVVRLLPDRKRRELVTDFAQLGQVVRQAFGQRRKTLRNALKPLLNDELLEELHIDPGSRPENVSVSNYVNIANMLYKQHFH